VGVPGGYGVKAWEKRSSTQLLAAASCCSRRNNIKVQLQLFPNQLPATHARPPEYRALKSMRNRGGAEPFPIEKERARSLRSFTAMMGTNPCKA